MDNLYAFVVNESVFHYLHDVSLLLLDFIGNMDADNALLFERRVFLLLADVVKVIPTFAVIGEDRQVNAPVGQSSFSTPRAMPSTPSL